MQADVRVTYLCVHVNTCTNEQAEHPFICNSYVYSGIRSKAFFHFFFYFYLVKNNGPFRRSLEWATAVSNLVNQLIRIRCIIYRRSRRDGAPLAPHRSSSPVQRQNVLRLCCYV